MSSLTDGLLALERENERAKIENARLARELADAKQLQSDVSRESKLRSDSHSEAVRRLNEEISALRELGRRQKQELEARSTPPLKSAYKRLEAERDRLSRELADAKQAQSDVSSALTVEREARSRDVKTTISDIHSLRSQNAKLRETIQVKEAEAQSARAERDHARRTAKTVPGASDELKNIRGAYGSLKNDYDNLVAKHRAADDRANNALRELKITQERVNNLSQSLRGVSRAAGNVKTDVRGLEAKLSIALGALEARNQTIEKLNKEIDSLRIKLVVSQGKAQDEGSR
jgi:chromosome segregation ATPase